ncbi:MAG: DUF1598 domain-containing protein [Pirellulaceae bacterium]
MARTLVPWLRVVCVVAAICLCPFASAQDADPIAGHLAAGEFAPALAAADRLPDPDQRDAALGRIAAAQAQAGAADGSLSTAGSMSSDSARGRAIDQLRDAITGRGGGVIADFDTLIDLITTTVDPDSWEDVGGPGTIAEFPTGVYVDAGGVLKKFKPEVDRSLGTVRASAAFASAGRDPRQKAALRKVSLPRLERAVQLLYAQGRQPDEAMRTLAGLQKIQYVLIYPGTGDIVLAGPAGDWRPDEEGRIVDVEKGRPVVQLDDLVTVLRNAYSKEPKFGCAITPTQENLAAAKATIERWAAKPISPSQRGRWLEDIRSSLGKQDVTIHGIDPRTRAARVIVEADYRMKLVGMGLEPGVLGVESYLASIELKPGAAPPAMNVLRWWFTLNYDNFSATEPRDAFELKGPGVKVLSENELLTEKGERVHTGSSDELNARFARSFTKHFEALAAKYPVYADLRNVFDLALVTALLKSEDVPSQIGWEMTHFGPQGRYDVALGGAPTHTESVVNHRVIGSKTIVAGISGGVTVDPQQLVKADQIKTDTYGVLKGEHKESAPASLPRSAWWWD